MSSREHPKFSQQKPEAREAFGLLKDKGFLAILGTFIFHLFLVAMELLPTLRDINLWDEAVYINTGKLFVEGQLTPYFRNPLVGILYALTYLPFQSSPFWLVKSATLGRVILFGLLWLSAALVGRRFEKWVSSYTVIGFLVVFPLLTEILVNPSDALFAAMSAFGLWQFLGYFDQRRPSNLLWTSVFIGLVALARNDGLLLFFIYLILVVLVSLKTERKLFTFAAAILPFLAVVGGYLLIYGLVTGEFVFGTSDRTYVAFQQGHMFVYESYGECKHQLGCDNDAVDALFGTPVENDYAIFKAIRRNPGAYSQRVVQIVKQLPQKLYYAYGLKTGYLMLLLAVRGVWVLIQEKRYRTLLVLAAWPAYLAIYFLTFFREGYLMAIFYILFPLGALGIDAIVRNVAKKSERLAWTFLLTGLVVLGFSLGRMWLYVGAVGLLFAIWLTYFVAQQLEDQAQVRALGLMVMLVVGLVVRGKFTPFELRDLTEYAEEQAILELQDHLEPGSRVVAGAPGSMWAARMEYISIYDPSYAVSSGEEMLAILQADGVDAIYVDHYLSNDNRAKWGLIESQIGEGIERIYAGREGSIQVLLVDQGGE